MFQQAFNKRIPIYDGALNWLQDCVVVNIMWRYRQQRHIPMNAIIVYYCRYNDSGLLFFFYSFWYFIYLAKVKIFFEKQTLCIKLLLQSY